MLVGTISSHEEREIAEDIIKNFAQEQNISYFECHIDNGKGIDEAFSTLLDKIMEKFHYSSRDLGGQSHREYSYIVNFWFTLIIINKSLTLYFNPVILKSEQAHAK